MLTGFGLSFLALAEDEDFVLPPPKSHKINFIVITEKPRESARWEDILTERPAKKEGDAPIPTLRIHPSNMVSPLNGRNNAEIHKRHFERVTNLTNLNQLFARDEVAKILSEIPCRPGTTANLVLYATEQKDMQEILKIPTPWVPWKFNFSRCLVGDNGEHISLPNGACLYPHHDSSQMSDVNYDELIRELKKCRDAIQKKVHDDKLLDKWKATNDPNKAGAGSTRHDEKKL